MDDLKEQFGIIYEQHIEKIYRFVYLKVNSQEIAEDITSKVFLKGWERYRKDNKIENPKAFLYQIARNAVIDYYRDRGRTKIVSADNIFQIADNKTNPHDKAVFNSDIEIVKSAIQELQKDHQDIIIWHYLEDMSVEEISQILNKSTGAIRVILHRSLNVLKGKLNKI